MIVFKKSIPRRTFLRGVGTTLALPLLDAMVPALASSAEMDSQTPLRMGFVYVPNGMVMEKWTPATEGAGFKITPILEALTPLRDHLLVLSGLNNNQAVALPGEGGAFHGRTTAAFLTGHHPKPSKGDDMVGGVSVDQIAAKELSKHTQLASLELALDQGEPGGICEGELTCAYTNTLCWRTPVTPLPMEFKPRAVFERLFGDADATDTASRISRIQENRSILDFLSGEVARLEPRLHGKDRAKLSEYLDAIRDVERRIQIAEEQASRELPTVARPAEVPVGAFEDYAKLMFDMQLLAYQTDLTRVGTLAIGHEFSSRTYSEIGVPESHHPLSHNRGDAVLIEKEAKINAYHIKLFSYYLERLRSTRDGDGSLLDHSMIVYGAGMADGNMHTNQNIPILLAGGGGGKIKGGRHVRYPKDTPLTNLYLSMLDIMGTPAENLGDSTGKLDLHSVA